MSRRAALALVLVVLTCAGPAQAQSHHGGVVGPVGLHHHRGGGGWYGFGWGPYALVPVPQPIFIVPATGFPPAGPALPPPAVARGLAGVPHVRPVAHPAPARGAGAPVIVADRARNADGSRVGQLVTVGDRLFRNGNLHRAAERYEQAVLADPNSAAPRLRLAQVALLRGQYTEAANRLREAQAAEPGWLLHAPDIQAIYGEPGDFAAPIAKLETHLQVQPNDRDAWLVLGAQWYLSGRTRQAADVFRRLTDRAPDPTLSAFLEASTPPPAHP